MVHAVLLSIGLLPDLCPYVSMQSDRLESQTSFLACIVTQPTYIHLLYASWLPSRYLAHAEVRRVNQILMYKINQRGARDRWMHHLHYIAKGEFSKIWRY